MVDHGAPDGEMQAPGRPTDEDAEGLYTRRLGDSAAVVSGGARQTTCFACSTRFSPPSAPSLQCAEGRRALSSQRDARVRRPWGSTAEQAASTPLSDLSRAKRTPSAGFRQRASGVQAPAV
jgi:hypothetical protein